jgi:hypothetical protein
MRFVYHMTVSVTKVVLSLATSLLVEQAAVQSGIPEEARAWWHETFQTTVSQAQDALYQSRISMFNMCTDRMALEGVKTPVPSSVHECILEFGRQGFISLDDAERWAADEQEGLFYVKVVGNNWGTLQVLRADQAPQ